jgi:hypothetical protein
VSRIRQRQAAALTLACADVQDATVAAKEEHASERTGQTRTGKVQAMAALYETRAWLRAKAELDRLPGVVERLRVTVEHTKDPDTRRKEQARLNAAEARLARIAKEFGGLVADMDALAGGES